MTRSTRRCSSPASAATRCRPRSRTAAMPDRLPRRAVLAAGFSGAAAIVLGARAAVAAEGPDPGPALTALVGAEHDAVFVYRTAGLEGDAAVLAEQEEEHARALASHLQALG